MMQAALSPDSAELGPILVDPSPSTKEAALANLLAFSNEVRLQQSTPFDSSLSPVKSIPRLRQCYGWLQLTGDDLLRLLPRRLYPPEYDVSKIKRYIDPDVCYTAVVYEFVEEARNNRKVVQEVLDFFWRVGFSHVLIPMACNWKSGVLVDLSDIIYPKGYGWSVKRFGSARVRRMNPLKQILRWPAPEKDWMLYLRPHSNY